MKELWASPPSTDPHNSFIFFWGVIYCSVILEVPGECNWFGLDFKHGRSGTGPCNRNGESGPLHRLTSLHSLPWSPNQPTLSEFPQQDVWRRRIHTSHLNQPKLRQVFNDLEQHSRGRRERVEGWINVCQYRTAKPTWSSTRTLELRSSTHAGGTDWDPAQDCKMVASNQVDQSVTEPVSRHWMLRHNKLSNLIVESQMKEMSVL